MKILFPLENYYPSDIGGPANALYWHTQMLKKNGIDSVVVTSDVGTETKGIKSDEWIIDGNSKLIYCSGGRLSFKIFRNTLKEIGKCDAVHLSSVCYPYNVFITVYAIFKGKRVIISPRGELFPQAYKTKKYFLKTVLFSVYRLFQKQILLTLYSALSQHLRNPFSANVPQLLLRVLVLRQDQFHRQARRLIQDTSR